MARTMATRKSELEASDGMTEARRDEIRELLRTGFLIHDVSRLRHRLLDRHVRSRFGITRHQWWLLVQLTRHGGDAMTQVELSRFVDIGKVPLGKTIDKLEQKGLIERTADASDRRSKRVSLSAQGRELILQMRAVAITLGDQIMIGIGESRRKDFNELLKQMKQNLVALELSAPGESEDA
jgi:DNA-binding MarR family transcriptional regulator